MKPFTKQYDLDGTLGKLDRTLGSKSECINRLEPATNPLALSGDAINPDQPASTFSVENLMTSHLTDMSPTNSFLGGRNTSHLLSPPVLQCYSRPSDMYRNTSVSASGTMNYGYSSNLSAQSLFQTSVCSNSGRSPVGTSLSPTEDGSGGSAGNSPHSTPTPSHAPLSQGNGLLPSMFGSTQNGQNYPRPNSWYMGTSEFTPHGADFSASSTFANMRDMFESQRLLGNQNQGTSPASASSCQLAAFRSTIKNSSQYPCDYGKF